MKRAILAALLFAVSVGGSPAEAGVGKGQKSPEFALSTLKGDKRTLASLRGKVVVLDFWAQWCEPCKKELPGLEQLARQYAGKDVVFLGVNVDKQRDNAERFVKQNGITFDILLDPTQSLAATFELPKMPSSFVIDKKGVVRFVHEGFDGPGDLQRFKSEIDQLLK